MKKIINLSARYPWLVLCFLGLVTLVALSRLPDLQVEITAEGMMVDDEPAVTLYQDTLETFGSEDVTVVYMEDPDLFEPGNLSLIRDVLARIEKIPQVSRTVSLFSMKYLRTLDGFVYTDPYLKEIPKSRQAANAVMQAALINPLVKRNLLSENGSVMAINVYFDMQEYQRGFDERVAHQMDLAIQPLKERFRRVFHLGNPSVRSAISEQIRVDQKVILPLALLVLVVTLGFTLRRWNAALIPLLTAGLSVLWILGLMAALGIPVNVMTSIVPALLIIVGSTEDIHLLSEYQRGIRGQRERRTAIEFMADNMGTAVTLTFLTTFLGFLSISINRIDLLQQFGVVTAVGLLLNFLITVTLVPVSLELTGRFSDESTLKRVGAGFEKLANRIFKRIFLFPRLLIAGLLMLMVVCFYWATQIQVNNNVLDYFEPDSKLPQQAHALHRNLSGMQALSIVLTGSEGTFLQVPYLESLNDFQEYLQDTGLFDKSFSFADFIGVIHSGIDGQRPDTIYLPVRNEVVKEYMSLLDYQHAKPFVSADYSQARILVRHNISSSHQLNQAVEDIRNYAHQWLDPQLRVEVTGGSFLNSQAVDYMADGQVRSLLLMLFVIFGFVAALFMNLKAGLVAVIANLFPIVILFGVMGLFGFALDTGTTMVGAIALGICVDHTMHFMVRYQRLAHSGISEVAAIGRVISQEAVPIIATAFALAMGFATLMFSNFPPVARFGMLSGMVMLLALVSTFVVIPLMLRNTRLTTVWDLLSVKLKREVLEGCPLFKDMRPWQARRLVVLSQIQNFGRDEAVLMQGDRSQAMFVVLEGELEVWRTRTDGSAVHVTDYRAGDVFGVTSMVSGKERLTDVVAVQPVRALVLDWQDARRLARIFPRISARLHENLSTIIGNRLFDGEPERQSFKDELSGLYCASFLQELLTFIVNKANRYDESLCLVVFSVQDDGGIEQEYGRQALHWVLRVTAQIVKKELRRVDLFARWRSGKFFLMLPTTQASDLEKILLRIDAAVQQADFGVVPVVRLLVQWSVLQDGEQVEQFIERTERQVVRKIITYRTDTESRSWPATA